MIKKVKKITVVFAAGYLLLTDFASAALFDIWAGTGKDGQTCNVLASGCSFCDGMKVAINLVNNLTAAAVVITTGMIIYGAIRMMISAGSETALKEAKGIITSAVIGLVIVLCGWLIVNTLIHFIAGQIDFPWANVQC